jgi:signal transduction histidine kinase
VFYSFRSRFFALTNLGTLLVFSFIVTCLRSTVNFMETIRRKEERAEQQLLVAYEQQQQLMRQKELFLGHINHELRSPLTTIYSSLQILKEARDAHRPLPDAYQTKCLNQALQGCECLVLLTNQVLEATCLNRSVIPPRPQELSVAQVVQELLEHGDPRITQVCRVSLDLSEHVKVWADQQLVSQILWNLLSNVAKYCPPQTPVVISAAPCGRISASGTPATVCIRVKDAGPGIPLAEVPYLFEPFTRLKRNISMSVSGSGLGLYISKQMVEAMGGQIWVESAGVAEEGSCFCFTLPITA